MIVGCHSGNNNYTLQSFIDQKVQQTTRNLMINVHSLTRMILIRLILQMLCLFHSSCRLIYRRLAATRLQLANRADVEDGSA
jgi:hypothetical protein